MTRARGLITVQKIAPQLKLLIKNNKTAYRMAKAILEIANRGKTSRQRDIAFVGSVTSDVDDLVQRLRNNNFVVFISHEDTRTGATRLLISFVEWWKRNSSIPVLVVLRETTGAMINEFRSLAPVVRYGPDFEESFFSAIDSRRILAVLSNTCTNFNVQQVFFRNCAAPIFCYIHELEYAMHVNTTEEARRSLVATTRMFIAGSEAVASFIETGLGISKKAISVVRDFSFFNLQAVSSETLTRKTRKGPFKIGAMGSWEWRKGSDLFLPLARLVERLAGDSVQLIWYGVKQEARFLAEYDIKRMGLSNVELRPFQDDPEAAIRELDAFILLSREDPSPLVNLIAASAGIPIIAFQDSGGTPELLADGAGVLVPYLDLEAMAASIVDLSRNPDMGKILAAKCRERLPEYHGEKCAKELHGILLGSEDN